MCVCSCTHLAFVIKVEADIYQFQNINYIVHGKKKNEILTKDEVVVRFVISITFLRGYILCRVWRTHGILCVNNQTRELLTERNSSNKRQCRFGGD